jgi:hypothetical protein
VNDCRFTVPVDHISETAKYNCDVCFVSHASTSAESLLQGYLAQADSKFAVRFWTHLFESLKQIYNDGKSITNPLLLRRMIDQSIAQTKVTISPDQIRMIEFVFGTQINNAFFRHQSLQWLADAGVNLHLYGKGWEKHSTLAPFARGPADNATQLASIYRSSKINLHISPHGAVHQRVMEGSASGGFFMLRYCAGDMTERFYKIIWDFCKANQITTDVELQKSKPPEIQPAMDGVFEIFQESPFAGRWSFMETLRSAEENGYIRGRQYLGGGLRCRGVAIARGIAGESKPLFAG